MIPSRERYQIHQMDTRKSGSTSSLLSNMMADTKLDGLLEVVEIWGLPPLIPLLQCVTRLGLEICSVDSRQSEQGSWLQ